LLLNYTVVLPSVSEFSSKYLKRYRKGIVRVKMQERMLRAVNISRPDWG
jgi:hypothetical protein